MAREAGVSRVLVGGLCNNELGYVMPPSYFVLNPELPFLDTYKDISGEDHYEETNSVGVHTAERVLGGLKALFRKLK